MDIDLQKQITDALSLLARNATIKDCSHPNKSECRLPIKGAHSLQKNGVLKYLEKAEKGNAYIYCHYERKLRGADNFYDLKKIGRGDASTFFGFCDFHDTELFKSIENDPNSTDINNDEHCFLHSYRSFSHSYHRKYEELKLYNSKDAEVSKLLQNLYGPALKDKIKGIELAIHDFEKPKKKLDKLLLEKDYSGLDYLCFEFPHTIPVACASVVTPDEYYSGAKFNHSFSKVEDYSDIITTVLPLQNRSVVILSAFSDDERALKYLDEIENIKYNLEQEKFLSFHILVNSENVFLSPQYYNPKSEDWKRRYCSILDFNASDFTPFFSFNKKLPINYFDKSEKIIL
ncbi:hypothetical protein D3C87_438920 [compost metagenome]